MKKYLVVLISLLSGTLAFAADSQSLLERDLSKYMLSLDHQIKVYSYFNVTQVTSEFQSPQGRQQFLKRYFNQVMNRFWDLNLNDADYINAGPGLYAAIDPFISKQYGNTMVEIGVEPDTKYLDLHLPIPMGADTIQALVSEGIISRALISTLFVKNGTHFDFWRDTLKIMIKPEFGYFRRMIHNLFSLKEIVMVEYNWDTSLAGFCRLQRYSAFVMFGEHEDLGIADSFKKTLVFGSELPNLTPDEKLAAARTEKFKSVLGEIKLKLTYREKANIMLKNYPDLQERSQLIRQTYSCEM